MWPYSKTEKQSELIRELEALNSAVDAALAARRDWMDSHMEDFAGYKVGEELFFKDSGRSAGVVKELYRFHARNHEGALYDTSMGVDYRFDNGDNTSRYGGAIMFCNGEELAKLFEQKAETARFAASPEGKRMREELTQVMQHWNTLRR